MLKKHYVSFTSAIPEVTWYEPLYNTNWVSKTLTVCAENNRLNIFKILYAKCQIKDLCDLLFSTINLFLKKWFFFLSGLHFIYAQIVKKLKGANCFFSNLYWNYFDSFYGSEHWTVPSAKIYFLRFSGWTVETFGLIVKKIWRCPWCNGYRRRKWTRRHEFKSWTRLIAFPIALIPLGKVWIQSFTLQLWVNSRANWVLQSWWGN